MSVDTFVVQVPLVRSHKTFLHIPLDNYKYIHWFHPHKFLRSNQKRHVTKILCLHSMGIKSLEKRLYMNINMSYLAHIIHAVINIYCAVFSGKACFTFTCIMGKMIHTNTAILTRSIPFTIARLPRAESYFSFTLTSSKSSRTGALIWADKINTCGVVLAGISNTIINVGFTSDSIVSGRTFASM